MKVRVKPQKNGYFFQQFCPKQTQCVQVCTEVRHILVHVHVSVKFYMWPLLKCFRCKSALQCSLNMYCMHYTCTYMLQSPGPVLLIQQGIEPMPTYTAPLKA